MDLAAKRHPRLQSRDDLFRRACEWTQQVVLRAELGPSRAYAGGAAGRSGLGCCNACSSAGQSSSPL